MVGPSNPHPKLALRLERDWTTNRDWGRRFAASPGHLYKRSVDLKAKLALLGRRGGPVRDVEARAATLEELRLQVQAILDRPVPPPRAAADPAASLLPFAARQTPSGPLYQRLERLPASHHVGRMCVDVASSAGAGMLALLALDPTLAGLDLARALYLDTETTGLGGGAGTLAFLVGMAWFDAERRLVMEQLLLRSPGQEAALLELVRERFEHASVLVTYNGKAFDLPLLLGRCVMNRLPPLPARPHLDLLHIGRRLHKKRLGACRLVSLEAEVLGFERGPDIDGGDIGARYAHFLRTGDEEALRAVVDHNALDVISMAALVALYGEPLEALHDHDLPSLARALARAKSLERARQVAEAAVARGVGSDAHRARGEIAKARGDRALALLDFELFAAEVDDARARLELAKLYEHHVKAPLEALKMLDLGTGESDEAAARRRARLERKLSRG